jgi:DNA polymerase III subunit delta'
MPPVAPDPAALLERSLESGRLHSAYLVSGPGAAPRDAALRFVRGVVCAGPPPRPCEQCASCRRSSPREEIPLDGTGRKGPLLRHVGDHADLFWVERGADDTRVRIGQVRALQHALRLRATEGGRRAAVIADAEWLNQESQNALLRLLEEPPRDTTLVLAAASSAGLLATVRSRCQRVAFRPTGSDALDDPAHAEIAARLDALGAASLVDLLDWAEEYRGARAQAAAGVEALLETAGAWLRRRVREESRRGDPGLGGALEAARVLSACRKALVQRNANPQMVAERALLTLQERLRG